MEVSGSPSSPYRVALYRAYDQSGNLLYVGISRDWAARWNQHRLVYPEYYDVATLTIKWYPGRVEAMAAERIAIRTENPKLNFAGKPRA